ncbi:hypothetical protein PILCRDRAFT_715467 [Piloderma croceum F 1598]|uniref:NACHT domain-containing protein n=1 Tax=Piloderma croceum (strain F 1598) TaxID=765440 RepID=A0A0C3AJF6_PILCF|nr:hypothetical protein PILCRDRAFT_715467 [Piloderma croceum F 1598]
MSIHLATATSISMGTPEEQRSNDLWAVALETLSDADRQNIHFDSPDKLKVLSDLQALTERAREECIRKRWKYTRNGKTVVLRDVFDKVLQWVEMFKNIGDVVAQHVPASVALPWAGIGFLLDIVLKDFAKYSFLVDGVELISRLIDRYIIFENLYLQHASAGAASLRDALTSLYAAILKYLSQTKAYFNQNTISRIINSAVVSKDDFKILLEDIGLQQMHVDRCANLVDAEYRNAESALLTKIASDQTDTREELLTLLKTLSGPISRMNSQLNEIQDHLEAMERRKFLQFLSPLPHKKYHEQTRKNVLKGTGQWLLEDPIYNKWRHGNTSSLLWLHGNPGCGKSRLMSIVIDQVLRSCENGHGPPPAFFYCSRDTAEPKRSNPDNVLASIAKQLACIEPGGRLLEPARNLQQKKKEESSDSPDLEETHSLLTELIDCYPVTMILIDALDECDPNRRHVLLESLSTVIQHSPGVVKILVSSRDDQDIAGHFDSFPSIVITSNRNQADLANFVTKETNTLIEKRRLLRSSEAKEELKSMIIEKLIADANGMFLWAALQLEVMCTMKLDDEIRERLGRLPAQLAHLYREIYERFLRTEASRLTTGTILKWLMCAQSTLASAEFLAAISLNPARWGRGIKPQRLFTKQQVLDLCCNLVVYDNELDTFRFAHLSVREFLEEQEEYSQLSSNALAAETCLLELIGSADCPNAKQFLLDKCKIDIRTTSVPTKISFHEYALAFWPKHCISADDRRLFGLLKDMVYFFLFDESGNASPLEIWVQSPYSAKHFYHLRRDLDLYLHPLERSFLIACVCGFCDILDICLSKGILTDGIKQRGLELAANGQQRAFNLILDDSEYNTVEIPEAVIIEIVRFGENVCELLSSFLDRKKKFSITAHVLDEASRSKDHKVMRFLLEHAKVNQITTRVLTTTAQFGTPANMRLLLDRLGDKAEITSYMLYMAMPMHNSDTEKLNGLLDYGATISDDVFYYAVLSSEAEALLKELEDLAGTRIECTEYLLVAAASYGDLQLVIFLLNRGGTVTEKVVEAAASNYLRGLDILEVLLQHWDGRIPDLQPILREAADHPDGYKRLMLLLDKQGELEITSEMLKESGYRPEVLRLLLERGGRTKVTEEVLLATARHWNCNELVPVLLSAGENVMITEEVLVAVMGNLDYGNAVQSIIDRTSLVDLTDKVLEAAAGNRKNAKEMIQMLFDRLGEARITEGVVMAAVGNFGSGMHLLALFEERGFQVEILPEVLKAAASRGSSQMILELVRRAGSLKITEDILLAAATNIHDVEIMPIFLNLVGTDRITDEKLRALFYCGFNKRISERVAIAVASCRSHEWECVDIMTLFLGRAVTVEITEKVLEAAARSFYGAGLLQLLLDRLGHSATITEAVIKASVCNGCDGMFLLALLEKHGPIQMTDDIFKAAVSHGSKEMVQELMSRMENVEVTEELLVAASANRTEVFTVFLRRSGSEVVTDEVLKAVIENNESAASGTLAEIFRQGYRKKIPEQVAISAAARRFKAIHIMKVLLKQGVDIEITEEVVKKAAENKKCREELLKMLLERCAKENIPLSVDYRAEDK